MASDTKDIKAVIFDMDGVILDSESISKKSWFMAGKDFDLPEEEILLAFEKSTGCNRLDTQLFFTRMFGEKIDYNIFHEKCSFYFDEIAAKNGIPLMKNAAEILQYLKPKYRIALASSTTADRVVPQLTAVNVIDFFEVLVTGDRPVFLAAQAPMFFSWTRYTIPGSSSLSICRMPSDSSRLSGQSLTTISSISEKL